MVDEQGTTLTDLDGRSSFTTDTSLFWAIRGGGGGTWGVVISFTFKLHFAPQRIRSVVMSWALNYKGKLTSPPHPLVLTSPPHPLLASPPHQSTHIHPLTQSHTLTSPPDLHTPTDTPTYTDQSTPPTYTH